jgi:hypothetical protein
MSIREHLISRGLNIETSPVIIDDENQIATFLLWDLSGRLAGYQQYNPFGTKDCRNDEKFRDILKYYTYAGEEGEIKNVCKKKLVAYGFHTLEFGQKILFLTEGVFDAVKIHNAGFPALAVLTNNPQHLKSTISSLSRYTIAIRDDDKAGTMLKKCADVAFSVPAPYHDLGEMPQLEVNEWLSTLGFKHVSN